MIEKIVIIALIITAIHVSTYDGMIFGALREKVDALFERPKWKRVAWIRKPLYDCNVCMGGVWTVILYPSLFGIDWQIIPVMLGVIGANVIVAAILKFIYHEEDR